MDKPTGRQIAAGRTLIGMSQSALADAARISTPTLKRMEASEGLAVGMTNNVGAVVGALEAAGVIFIAENGEGPGVRLRKDRPDSTSFRAFIMRAPITNDPEGDFIRDARVDREMPDAKEWPEVLSYLGRIGASERVISASEGVWDRYLADKASQG